MGTYAEAFVQIALDNEQDAEKVCEMIHNIKERTLKRIEETSCNFNVHTLDQFGVSVELTLDSSRMQNTDWQVEQIIVELKIMVRDKEIEGVGEFSSSIMIAGEGHYLEADEFEDFSGCYSSIHDFIEQNQLKEEADKLFGEDWEAENDVEQVKELANSIGDYTVGTIEEKTARDARADNYIKVTK